MKKDKIMLKYPLIVEGKYDKIHLSSIIGSPIFTTNGFSVFNSPQKKQLLKKLAESKKLLFLTDSDAAGNLIRSKIKGYLPADSIINIYSPKTVGVEARKKKPTKENILGVEGIDIDKLYEILLQFKDDSNLSTDAAISKGEFFADGFSGAADSSEKRQRLAAILGLPDNLTSNALLELINLTVNRNDYDKAAAQISKEG